MIVLLYILETMTCSWHSRNYSTPFGWAATFSWPLMSLRSARDVSLGRWLLVACFWSVKNHNISGPHLFPSFTTHGVTMIRWPKMRIIRISNFLRIVRIIRFDQNFDSIFWKFWKPPHFYSFSSFQNFWQNQGKTCIYGYLHNGTTRIQTVDVANKTRPSNH